MVKVKVSVLMNMVPDNIPSISSTANQEFCIPCTENGNSYTNVDGNSVQCTTIVDYLTTTDGKNALIAAMEKIDNTNTFNFNINGMLTIQKKVI